MKKTFALTIVSLLILSANLFSQWGWFQLNSGVDNNLKGICSHYGDLWAVGSNGLLLKSTNSGANWVSISSGTNANLRSINFEFGIYAQYRGIITGSNGTLLITTNGGNTWSQVNSSVTADLNACVVSRFDSTIAVVVGNGGTVIKSYDAGITWQQRTSGTTASLNSVVQSSSDIVVAAGQGGVILASYGFGEGWFQSPSGTANDLNSIIQYTNLFANLFIGGNNGTLLRSSDNGYSWQPVASGTNQNLLSLSYITFEWNPPYNYPYLFAAGANGTCLRSTNEGSTWQTDYIPVGVNLNSVNYPHTNLGLIAGDNGTILKNVSTHYYIDTSIMDANTISTSYSNGGSFNKAGFEWPKATGKHARFSSGLWLGAIVNGDTLVAISQFDNDEYYSGYTDNNGVPHGRNDSNYRVYKLSYGVNNNDRIKWPNSILGNSDQGAPVYYDTTSSSWKPLDFGSQTQYYVYTDSYPEAHKNYFCGTTEPLKADIKQLNFALDVAGGMGNVILTQYTIINRSNSAWNNAYLTIWTDDDIGEAGNDKIGCDSALSLGYTYNPGSDTTYGTIVPAVGFVLLKGTAVYTGINSDTVYFCRNKIRDYRTGIKDLRMSVFNYSSSTDYYYPDPYEHYEAYNLMKGLHVNGAQIYNPNSGYVTKLMFTGNPVAGTGWNQSTASDVRFYISSGPVNMNPGDTQTIVAAQIIAQGTSSLNSITLLKQYTELVREYYKSCYTSIPIGIISSNGIAGQYRLSQNYPNPFNPKTKIKFSIPSIGAQYIEPLQLIIYDILGREVAVLVNERLKAGTYEVEWNASNFPSGIYFYRITAGQFTDSKKMVLVK